MAGGRGGEYASVPRPLVPMLPHRLVLLVTSHRSPVTSHYRRDVHLREKRTRR